MAAAAVRGQEQALVKVNFAVGWGPHTARVVNAQPGSSAWRSIKVHMRLRTFIATLALLQCIAGHASADLTSDSVPIMGAVGWNGADCYGDCIDFLKRQRWLALVPAHDGWSVVPTQLSFDDVDSKGLRSTVARAEFYLSHPAILTGHATTPNMRFKDNARRFYPDTEPMSFVFHDRKYDVMVDGNDVVLRSGRRRTPIGDISAEMESSVAVMWIGDLDGDGEIDLIIDKSNTKNGQLCLLLSSVNKDPANIAAEVGCQFFSG